MDKYIVRLLTFLTICVFSIPSCEAQFIDKLKKRAEERAKNKIEQKIENKVDKTVDQTIDAPENAVKDSKKNKNQSKNENTAMPALDVNSLLNASKDVKVSESYDFSRKVTYVFKSSSTKQANEITYWFGSDHQIFAIETSSYQNAFIVYDLNQNAMLMFSEKDKKVQVMSMSMFGAIFDESDEDEEDFTFKKTLEVKKINGYTCQKYVLTSDSVEGEFWFSKDVDLKIADFSKAFLSMGKTSNQKIPDLNANDIGFLIEMKSKDKSTNEVTEMKVKEITKINKKITTSNYKKQ